jgi:hypothetical protein
MTSVQPYIPPASITQLRKLAEHAELITTSGEIVEASAADDESLVAWHLIAAEMRTVARLLEQSITAELMQRCQAAGGPVKTEYGEARESVSRGSVSGIAASRIRAILEECAADGAIPWDAVDNIAPLVPHVTPAKVANYIETCPTGLAEQLEEHLPEKRRTLKVEPREA